MERGTETSSHCISNYVVSPNVGRMESWTRQLLGLGGFIQKLSSPVVKLRLEAHIVIAPPAGSLEKDSKTQGLVVIGNFTILIIVLLLILFYYTSYTDFFGTQLRKFI